MVFNPLEFGHHLDLPGQNAFWNKVWLDNGGGSDAPFELKFARMWHHDAVVLNGGAIVRASIGSDSINGQSTMPFYSYYVQSPNAINDSWENYFNLDAGTYDFVIMVRTSSNAGIVSWVVDGNSIGDADLYSGSGAQWQLLTIPDVVIGTDGQHTITGTVASKNASSSSYSAPIYKYYFRETA
jgi:hypothetical protein